MLISVNHKKTMSEELRDFYYSEYTAAFDNGLCHTINGQKFTESVRHGEQPVTQDPNIMLVASELPQSAVVYNTKLIQLNRVRKIESRGTLMQIESETQTSRLTLSALKRRRFFNQRRSLP